MWLCGYCSSLITGVLVVVCEFGLFTLVVCLF